MKIGSYTVKLAKRLDALGATFVRSGNALLVARLGEEGFELELIDLPDFKTVRRETVDGVAAVTRVGENKVLLMLPAEPPEKGTKKYPQSFELRSLHDFSLLTTFVEEKPGAVAASPDGRLIAVAHDFGNLNIWNADTGNLVSEYAAKGIGAVAFSPDGALLAAREFAGALSVFDGRRPETPLRSVKVSAESQMAFHPARHLVALAHMNAMTVVDADTAKVSTTIKATKRKSKDPIDPVAYSPDGKLLVTATSTDGIVGFWDMERGAFLADALALKAPMNRVEFDSTGKLLLLSSFEGAEIHSIGK